MPSSALFPLLLPSVVLLLLLLPAASVKVGGWTPIKDVSAPEVQEAARFAVTEHNRAAKSKLVYQRVEHGEQQVVSGINYRLFIVAKDGATAGKYEAVVWVKSWAHYMNLTSFTKLGS